jgi:hypothetical protein
VYDYDNLAVSCNGGAVEHCGHRKAGQHGPWFSEPHAPTTAALFAYAVDGSIAPAKIAGSAGSAAAAQMICCLGLNCPRLFERRKAHARALIGTLGDCTDSALVAWVRQYYLQPDASGRLKQFVSLSKVILDP